MTGPSTQDVDVVILTALQVETAAVLAAVGGTAGHQWQEATVHRGEVAGQRVVVVPIGGMGSVRAAQTAQRAIDVWNPVRLLLVGIAGGVPAGGDDLRLGDVLVPDQVVGYELAKVRPGSTDRRWDVFRPDRSLVETARHLPPAEWVHTVSVPRPDGSDGRVIPRVHIGPVLSGDKVLADTEAVDGLRRAWPKMIGVEMESLGVALTAYTNGPGFLMVKAVSDYADTAKSDDWHRYAAAAAAQFAVAVLRRAPVGSDPSRPQAVRAAVPGTFSGRVKLQVCRNLGGSWKDVADLFEVPQYEVDRFDRGDEPRSLWHWLEIRSKLYALPDTLEDVGRKDLAEFMRTNG